MSLNLFHVELFIKDSEDFYGVYVGAESHEEAISKMKTHDLILNQGAEIQNVSNMTNSASPNTLYIP